MLLKIFNGTEIHIISLKEQTSFACFLELLNKNFKKIPKSYQLAYIDCDGDTVSLDNQSDMNSLWDGGYDKVKVIIKVKEDESVKKMQTSQVQQNATNSNFTEPNVLNQGFYPSYSEGNNESKAENNNTILGLLNQYKVQDSQVNKNQKMEQKIKADEVKQITQKTQNKQIKRNRPLMLIDIVRQEANYPKIQKIQQAQANTQKQKQEHFPSQQQVFIEAANYICEVMDIQVFFEPILKFASNFPGLSKQEIMAKYLEKK